MREGLLAAGSLATAPWLMRPTAVRAQDLATPVAVPGSGGEIGRPETVPIDHLVVIFLENRPFDHLYGLFPAQMDSPRPVRPSRRQMQTGFRTARCLQS